MASLIDLRRRIRSVKNTQQITRAMKMVAAARLRRAQEQALAARPYAEALREVVSNLAGQTGELSHPLLEQREEKKVLLAIVTGDKGLCGSFNTNVVRQAGIEIKKHQNLDLLLLGKRGREFFKKRPTPIRAAHTSLFSGVKFEAAAEIATDIADAFTRHEYDAVYVIYNKFVSVIQQKLTVERLLPVGIEADQTTGKKAVGAGGDYLYEPSAFDILQEVVGSYVASQMFRILLESQAAEHAARMTAMDSATKNAGDLIGSLTLTYNRSRQAAITKELIEVVSGAKALEG